MCHLGRGGTDRRICMVPSASSPISTVYYIEQRTVLYLCVYVILSLRDIEASESNLMSLISLLRLTTASFTSILPALRSPSFLFRNDRGSVF